MINLTANGNSVVAIENGGQYYLDANGTWSGSLAVQVKGDSTSYSPITTAVGTDLAITDDYNAVITLPKNSFVKFVLTGATSPNINIQLLQV